MKKFLAGLSLCFLVGITGFAVEGHAADMYRLYNPNSGEHFYTADISERNTLTGVGWKYEGISWIAPKTGEPVYRMYNPNEGDHHYTTTLSERDMLMKAGWRYEGIAWQSATNKKFPLQRLYNPNAKAGAHHYTLDLTERDSLRNIGWRYEGVSWYAESIPTYPHAIDQSELKNTLNFRNKGMNIPNFISVDFTKKIITFRSDMYNGSSTSSYTFKFSNTTNQTFRASLGPGERLKNITINTKIQPLNLHSGTDRKDLRNPLYLFYNDNGKVSLLTTNFAGNYNPGDQDVMLVYNP